MFSLSPSVLVIFLFHITMIFEHGPTRKALRRKLKIKIAFTRTYFCFRGRKYWLNELCDVMLNMCELRSEAVFISLAMKTAPTSSITKRTETRYLFEISASTEEWEMNVRIRIENAFYGWCALVCRWKIFFRAVISCAACECYTSTTYVQLWIRIERGANQINR